MPKILQLFEERELAISKTAIGEVDWYFRHVPAPALDDDLQENFVAHRVEVACSAQDLTPQREKAAHGIRDAGERQRQQGRYAAVDPAKQSPIVGRRSALREA
jgi:hypothetical protein